MTTNALRATLAVTALLALGCADTAESRMAAGHAVPEATKSVTAEDPAFHVTMKGAVEAELAGEDAVAGARYGRYHIALVGGGNPGDTPRTVISFARSGVERPAVGTYRLDRGGEMTGSLEIYGQSPREFTITGGELEITAGDGDQLTGRFSFTAREVVEEYGASAAELRGEGAFRTGGIR